MVVLIRCCYHDFDDDNDHGDHDDNDHGDDDDNDLGDNYVVIVLPLLLMVIILLR